MSITLIKERLKSFSYIIRFYQPNLHGYENIFLAFNLKFRHSDRESPLALKYKHAIQSTSVDLQGFIPPRCRFFQLRLWTLWIVLHPLYRGNDPFLGLIPCDESEDLPIVVSPVKLVSLWVVLYVNQTREWRTVTPSLSLQGGAENKCPSLFL